ncbi:hypothetical protein NL64_06450 [Pseudomonas fluorescens]|uniref:hypothetical protein n=1 Tax=Pseudomonas fluorescens TaxID=294 RepID=UPI00054BA1CA|nr:hypothetical protein [Pseudomonas fluorescens]KII34894.1 hypothetical protein NL64_06450 [Pseudomonas fluorescens]
MEATVEKAPVIDPADFALDVSQLQTKYDPKYKQDRGHPYFTAYAHYKSGTSLPYWNWVEAELSRFQETYP